VIAINDRDQLLRRHWCCLVNNSCNTRHHVQPFCRYVVVALGLADTAVSLVIWYMWVCLPCNYLLLHSAFRQPFKPCSPPQCSTHCWRCDISYPPCPAACSTVQLITVARWPVSPSLYSRWLRLELTQPSESQLQVIAISLVPDRK